MTTVSDIFSALGGPTAVARFLGVRPSTASEMKRRGSIPAEYWRDLVRAAERNGVPGIDATTLAEMHARPSGKPEGLAEPETPATTGERKAGRLEPRAGDARGHFSRFYHVRRPHFATADEIREHVDALRDEWTRR
ncbi:MAG: hypothetical protein K0S06_2518 [Microvirga sp.]|jgi:hypothetical protein|nr:hypothetical protein [Microvirga sp.]